MLKNEAIWIGNKTKNLKIANILDIGGGNWFSRNIRQPWIQKYIFKTFTKKKVKILHTDSEYDVCLKSFKSLGEFDLVFANNLLEHVKDIEKGSQNISLVVKVGGYLCVSVPYNFPYHPCPIDNMFRPTLVELVSLFPKFKVIAKKVVSQKTMISINRTNIFWFNSTFQASCVIMQKTAR